MQTEEPGFNSLRTHVEKLGVVVHTCNLQLVETEGSLGLAGQSD